MEELRDLLLYGGLRPEEFKLCQPEVRAANHRRLMVFQSLACGFFGALTLAACLIPVLYDHIPAFAAALLVCAGLLGVAKLFPEKSGLFLTWQIYAFAAMVYVLGIYLGTAQAPDERATSFFAFLLCIPLLFVMRPIQNITNTVFFDVIFLGCVVAFKDGKVIPMDICNGLVFGAISCIVSTYITKMLYNNFTIRTQLARVAENDLNTGLHNRNAYENKLRKYPVLCSNLLACIYVDVNGLHELNNSEGHEMGDKMLQVVGRTLQDTFGEDDTYRVGGDEFVAFALDMPGSEMNEKIASFKSRVEAAGYSVAIGSASHSAGGIDMDALVKKAEQRMYMDKKKHYSQFRSNLN